VLSSCTPFEKDASQRCTGAGLENKPIDNISASPLLGLGFQRPSRFLEGFKILIISVRVRLLLGFQFHWHCNKLLEDLHGWLAGWLASLFRKTG